MSKARAHLQIDTTILKSNYEELDAFLKEHHNHMICVVKCDGYGHDGIQEALLLQSYGADFFAVACLDEAIALREAGIQGDILILSHTPFEDCAKLLEYDLIQTIGDIEYGLLLNEKFQENQNVRVHLKIDTGMHRLGISHAIPWVKLQELVNCAHLNIQGALSHFAVADSFEEEDIEFTKKQKNLFDQWLEMVKKEGLELPCTHIQASAAIVNYPEFLDDYTHSRPGILFLGFDSGDMKYPYPRKEVVSLISQVEKVDVLPQGDTIGYGRTYQANQDVQVATIPIGYGDGVPRNYSHGEVLIHGKRCPIIGRISMDQMCVDVSDLDEVSIGDEVILIGTQENETITLREMADKANTIPNEIGTKFTNRLPRIYK